MSTEPSSLFAFSIGYEWLDVQFLATEGVELDIFTNFVNSIRIIPVIFFSNEMNKKLLIILFYFILFVHYAELSDSQRDGMKIKISFAFELDLFFVSEPTFIGNLFSAIKRLKLTFSNTKQGPNDDSFYNNAVETKNFPSVVDAVGFCAINGAHCDFLSCLAENFANGKLLGNLKKAEKLIVDNALRRAIVDSPQILEIACISGGLNVLECIAFREFLGLMDILDPDEAHIGDEPRDKRSPKLLERGKTKNVLVKNESNLTNISTYNDTKSVTAESNSSFFDDYYDTNSNTHNNTFGQPTTLYQHKNCTDLLKAKQITTTQPAYKKVTLKPNKGKKSG